jgi:hypothetical protein
MAGTTISRSEPGTTGIRSRIEGTPIGKLARVAGLLYLAIFVLWPLSTLVGESTIVIGGDAAATAENLIANETLFRWGMVGQSVVILIELVLAAVLYVIFRPVSRPISLAAAFGRMAEGVAMAVKLLTGMLALFVVAGTGALAAFDREQLDALGMVFLDANGFMDLVWGLFFALHLVLLGWLVYKSGFCPKLIGILLLLAGGGYFAETFGLFLNPDLGGTLETLVVVLAVPGELVFALWLVTKRINEDAWQQRALEAKDALV